MAKNFDIKGLKKVLKDLENLGDEGEDVIHKITRTTANNIAADAKLNTQRSFDTGRLSGSILPIEIDRLNYKIGTNLEYAGYIEFGTGVKVRIPNELASVANSFKKKGGGNFKEGLEAIKGWCKRKGIPVEAAYPIFVSLLNNGMTPKPFLYPAYVDGRDNYLNDLKDALEQLTRKV